MRLWIRGPEIKILTFSPGAFLFLRCFLPRLGICFLVCESRTVAQAPLRGKTHSLQVVFRAFTYPQPGMGTVASVNARVPGTEVNRDSCSGRAKVFHSV